MTMMSRGDFYHGAGLVLTLLGTMALCACTPVGDTTTKQTTLSTQSKPATLVGAQEFNLQAASNGRTYRIQVSAVGEKPTSGYPVLYVLDGDGTFAVASLAAQGMMMRMSENNAVPMLIVGVGYGADELIDLSARAKDYTPPAPNYHNTGDRLSTDFGGADAFYQFLSDELPHALAKQGYAINPKQQNIFGHSYGGLFVLYALMRHPEHFANYIAASPSIWWNQQHILNHTPALKDKLMTLAVTAKGVRLTVGEYEQKLAPYLPDNPERQTMLTARGMVSNTLKLGEQLKQYPQLSVDTNVYAAQTHASTVMPALNDGLKWLYERCRMDSSCYAHDQTK